MPNEPIWVPVEAVVEHNRLELVDTGEHHFVRDIGLLESALVRPRHAFAYGEEDLVILAITLMDGVSRAHAFEQGKQANGLCRDAPVPPRQWLRHYLGRYDRLG